MERKLILAIDFNNMVFGSYYGEKLINSKGMNVNAIKGFFFKVRSLKEMFNPDYIVMTNDLHRDKTFRRKLFKPYKAHRKPTDPDIVEQMKYTQQISSLLGYPFINNEEYEADDILGMLSTYTRENDYDLVINSSDKDLYQLVEDYVYIFSPRRKELIDKEWLRMNYKLTPKQWIELKMLMGDSADNIPGIDGIGEITALRLLNEYDTIENIYKNMKQHKPALQEKLMIGYESLPLMRDLVTIITDYNKIAFKPEMIENIGVMESEVFRVIGDLELDSLFNVMKYSLMVPKPIMSRV